MDEWKVALFDLDGVVFDTEWIYTEFWSGEGRRYLPSVPDFCRRIKGQTLTQIMDGYFAEMKDVQPQIVERLEALERRMTFRYVAGFEDFVHDLRRNGVLTAVVTSSNRRKMACVYGQHPAFRSCFDAVLTSEDFKESKPSPDCYLKGAAVFGVPAGSCVVFEDSFNGLKSGRGARMTVVGLATSHPVEVIQPFADHVICDYQGLDYLKFRQIIGAFR